MKEKRNIQRLRYLAVILLLCLLCPLGANAQKLVFDGVSREAFSITARTEPRRDANGDPCALVKVSLPLLSGVTFGEDVVGNIERDGSDYLIYMPKGTRYLIVKHPDFKNLEIDFTTSVGKLESNCNYRVDLTIPDWYLARPVALSPTAQSSPQQQPAAQQPQVQPAALAQKQYGMYRVIPSSSTQQLSSQPAAPRRDGNQTFIVGGVKFTMVYVEGGTFTMGATGEQGSDANDDEKPTHSVTLSDYYIGQTEVTQALWQAVMGSNPSYFRGDTKPVEGVSWDDCQTFVSKLNSMTGKTFRLPTEAEWEYAARGGKKSRRYIVYSGSNNKELVKRLAEERRAMKYSGSNNIDGVAWYYENSYKKGPISPDYGTHPVATKSANKLGLYDMSGNVWEWCSDWYGVYGSGSQTNPQGAASGQYRVGRGGGWSSVAGYCRVSYRSDSPTPDYRGINLGLRLALSQ